MWLLVLFPEREGEERRKRESGEEKNESGWAVVVIEGENWKKKDEAITGRPVIEIQRVELWISITASSVITNSVNLDEPNKGVLGEEGIRL